MAETATKVMTPDGPKAVGVVKKATPAPADVTANRYEISHEQVGQWKRGEVIQAKVFSDAGIDVERLLGLGAMKPIFGEE